MNIKILLFIFATICISFALSQNKLIKINNYQYEHSTNQQTSSILDQISNFKNNKKVDGSSSSDSSNSQSSSSSYDVCSSDNLVGGNYAQPGLCLYMNGESAYYEVDDNGNVNKTIYNDLECKNLKQQITININECSSSYSSDGTPTEYNVIDFTDMDYPSNSVLAITYGGPCHGSWKDYFVYSFYLLTDKCLNLALGSLTVTCNSTMITETISSTPGSCTKVGKVYNIPIGGYCVPQVPNSNFLSICNLS